ncbi:MAG: adenylate/guanylate cyclase domain-containing protein [Bacteroidota bacterium]
MKSRYIKIVLRHAIIWFFAFVFWVFMREFGQEVIQEDIGSMSFFQRVKFHLILGLIAGIIFGSLNYFSDKYIHKKISFGRTLLFGTFSHLVAVIVLITFGMRAFTRIIGVEMNREIYQDYIFSQEMILLVVYCFIVGFFINLFTEIDKKFGPGNLWKMLKGEFYSPKEEQRIFMFLDLKNSTGIAEKLGHRKYSELIQDCFQDVSEIVLKFKASIYQYVGDEIVLTWTIKEGLENLNCIRFYFAYKEKLVSSAANYETKYNMVPEFKAGLEMGSVMVAEVGDLKREIAYHGDVLNTAARIQGCCNQYGKSILISENIEKTLRDSLKTKVQLLGDVQLRGKQKNIRIYAVDQA